MNTIAEAPTSYLPTRHDRVNLGERLDALEKALAKLEALLKEMTYDTPGKERGNY